MQENDKVLVWDAPTRVFHWLMVLCFAGSWLSSEGERWLGVHLTLGYTMVALVAWRVFWGLVGTRYARFGNFIRGPKAIARYASAMLGYKAEHPVGHNPMGAVSIVLMLALTLLVNGAGWLYFNSGVHALKEVHEGAAAVMLMVVGVHVAGVVFASLMQRENLARSMVNGYKRAQATDAIRWSWWPVAVLLLAAVMGFWWLQWQSPVVDTSGAPSLSAKHGDDDD